MSLRENLKGLGSGVEPNICSSSLLTPSLLLCVPTSSSLFKHWVQNGVSFWDEARVWRDSGNWTKPTKESLSHFQRQPWVHFSGSPQGTSATTIMAPLGILVHHQLSRSSPEPRGFEAFCPSLGGTYQALSSLWPWRDAALS